MNDFTGQADMTASLLTTTPARRTRTVTFPG
jgi:hypothetical protein